MFCLCKLNLECALLNSHDYQTPPLIGEGPTCTCWEVYNKVFKHEVWCIPFCSVPPQGGSTVKLLCFYLNCGPVHEQKPMENCYHPLRWRSLNAPVANRRVYNHKNWINSNIGDINSGYSLMSPNSLERFRIHQIIVGISCCHEISYWYFLQTCILDIWILAVSFSMETDVFIWTHPLIANIPKL